MIYVLGSIDLGRAGVLPTPSTDDLKPEA